MNRIRTKSQELNYNPHDLQVADVSLSSFSTFMEKEIFEQGRV